LFGLLGTIVCVVAVVFLLARVLIAANSINDKAGDIKKLGGTINESTAAVLELGKTTDVAQKILDDAKPLTGQLSTTIGTASGISGLATSINNTAGQINNTAGQIQGSATSIDASAVSIDKSAASINQRVGDINGKLDPALALVTGVRGDTGAIRGTADKIAVDANSINTRLP
jgi:methyl-accepting chemotaxis protein